MGKYKFSIFCAISTLFAIGCLLGCAATVIAMLFAPFDSLSGGLIVVVILLVIYTLAIKIATYSLARFCIYCGMDIVFGARWLLLDMSGRVIEACCVDCFKRKISPNARRQYRLEGRDEC